MPRGFLLLGWLLGVLLACGCQRARAVTLAEQETLAELRAVKGTSSVTAPGQPARAPYRRERLVDGERVSVPAGGLVWMRRDGGATWLVSGPAEFTLKRASVELRSGRAFVDCELGEPARVDTPQGEIEMSDARASVDVGGGRASVYVLRGSARAARAGRVSPGELLEMGPNAAVSRKPAVAWEDWTGGFATADASIDPAPFGIGTVGARPPGDKGEPRASLVIQRLDVRVTIEQDFATTEVDETFVNPTSNVVEGLFRFRTPGGAVLERFGVDRDGLLVWGRVQESKSAAAQYQANVYQGSEEDPALLQWAGSGVYETRLYPIASGASRRVVTRYSEWLSRQGSRGERRLYVYPMAAEGAKASLPRIEELRISVDLSRSGAKSLRSGMGGQRDGQLMVVKAFDVVPRADFALELLDDGQPALTAYRTRHVLGERDAENEDALERARETSKTESDYLAIPLRAPESFVKAPPGVDLAIVVDASAATEVSALSLSRVIAAALLAHLGPDDRAALWTGDASLRPVTDGSGELTRVERKLGERWLSGLSAVERGGATDIGALLTQAASRLDPARRGAVVYIGDGAPSVGELAPKALRERLARLSPNTRVLVAAVGSQPNTALLETLVRGAPVEQVDDGYGAARAALRLLEAAGRPVWLGGKVDLGPGVERVMPRELPPIAADETLLVVGRVSGKIPSGITLKNGATGEKLRLSVRYLDDDGDLRRRWGEQRMAELGAEGAGRAALVETARRFGLVSPFTSLYVPTRREAEAVQQEDGEDVASAGREREERIDRWKPWARERSFGVLVASKAEAPPHAASFALAEDQKEGGTGTRARGEAPTPTPAASAAPPPPAATATASPAQLMPEEVAMGAVEASRPAAAGAGLAATGSKTRKPLAWARQTRRNMADAPDPLSAPLGDEPARKLSKKSRVKPEVPRESSRDEPEAPKAATSLARVAHEASPCSAAADLPLAERLTLWRERVYPSRAQAAALLHLYQQALSACEAPDWRARAALLVFLVDALPTVTDRVQLWRLLLTVSPRAADAVYRFLLLRVQTSEDLKQFHEALGFERIQPEVLEQFLAKAKTPAERLTSLRGAAERFADDTELALLVLEAYEDAGDSAGGRAWARKLRRRVDATAHVRTNVGEYYFRLAAQGSERERAHDSDEALRTFGELVEFAPEDPQTRRLLGDLLRAHGWYEEALRQYQTLADLTPDDPNVPLLMALAAQGTGKVEEAVRWAEKAAQSGSPDAGSSVAVAARALTSAFLAWAREDSRKAGKAEEAARIRTRAARLASAEADRGVRVVLSWAHPELRPALWTDALGSPLPADVNLPLLGVAQAFVPNASAVRLEVRVDPEDAARAARLGATATLTVIEGEGSATERISRREIGFRDGGGAVRPTVAVKLEGGALSEVEP
jgi:tetratricopeptide (TPR) repeat protein